MIYMVKCCENCIEYQEGFCEGLIWYKHDSCYWFNYKVEKEEEIINEIRSYFNSKI